MEAPSQKSLEKVLSQRALQMSSSFPCQICVVGLLCGVCLTSLFLAALTSIGTFEFGVFSFSGFSAMNSTTQMISKWVFFFFFSFFLIYILQLFANFALQFLSFMGNQFPFTLSALDAYLFFLFFLFIYF